MLLRVLEGLMNLEIEGFEGFSGLKGLTSLMALRAYTSFGEYKRFHGFGRSHKRQGFERMIKNIKKQNYLGCDNASYHTNGDIE